MIRFPWDVLSVKKSTCEVCTSSFRRQHHKFRRAPWQTRTSEEDISTKEWAFFVLPMSWPVNLCLFYRIVKVWVRFGHRWIFGFMLKNPRAILGVFCSPGVYFCTPNFKRKIQKITIAENLSYQTSHSSVLISLAFIYWWYVDRHLLQI